MLHVTRALSLSPNRTNNKLHLAVQSVRIAGASEPEPGQWPFLKDPVQVEAETIRRGFEKMFRSIAFQGLDPDGRDHLEIYDRGTWHTVYRGIDGLPQIKARDGHSPVSPYLRAELGANDADSTTAVASNAGSRALAPGPDPAGGADGAPCVG